MLIEVVSFDSKVRLLCSFARLRLEYVAFDGGNVVKGTQGAIADVPVGSGLGSISRKTTSD